MATSRSIPRAARLRPPSPAYSPSEFSRTTTKSIVSGDPLRNGLSSPGQELRRPHAGVLIEALADRQPQAPERDVIGHLWPADRAEIDRVELAQLVESVWSHHHPMIEVVLASPRKPFELEDESSVADLLQASSTCNPTGTTSLPIPSPGMTAIRKIGRFIVPHCTVPTITSGPLPFG